MFDYPKSLGGFVQHECLHVRSGLYCLLLGQVRMEQDFLHVRQQHIENPVSTMPHFLPGFQRGRTAAAGGEWQLPSSNTAIYS